MSLGFKRLRDCYRRLRGKIGVSLVKEAKAVRVAQKGGVSKGTGQGPCWGADCHSVKKFLLLAQNRNVCSLFHKTTLHTRARTPHAHTTHTRTHTAGHYPEQHDTNQQPYTPFPFSIIIIIIMMNLSNVQVLQPVPLKLQAFSAFPSSSRPPCVASTLWAGPCLSSNSRLFLQVVSPLRHFRLQCKRLYLFWCSDNNIQ